MPDFASVMSHELVELIMRYKLDNLVENSCY